MSCSTPVKDLQSRVTFLTADLRDERQEIERAQSQSDHADEGFATGVNRTPSPATITMVNNVLGRYEAVRERTQPVAGEHPSIRRTQENNSGRGVRTREMKQSPVL
jgi:hypothetical protein